MFTELKEAIKTKSVANSVIPLAVYLTKTQTMYPDIRTERHGLVSVKLGSIACFHKINAVKFRK